MGLDGSAQRSVLGCRGCQIATGRPVAMLPVRFRQVGDDDTPAGGGVGELASTQIDPHMADLVRRFEKHQIPGHQSAASHRPPGPDLQGGSPRDGPVENIPVYLLHKARTVHPPVAGTTHFVGSCPPTPHLCSQTVFNGRPCRCYRFMRARCRDALHLQGRVHLLNSRRRSARATAYQGDQQYPARPNGETAMSAFIFGFVPHCSWYRHDGGRTLMSQRCMPQNPGKIPLKVIVFQLLFPAGWESRCWGNH